MRRWIIGVVALAALALFGTASFAQRPSAESNATASATTLHIRGVSRCVMYSRDRGFPKPGTTEVDLCLGRSTGGLTPTESVGVGRTTITGHPSRTTWTYRATQQEITYGVGGIRIALTGQFRIRGHRVVDKGKGHVVDGTGMFAGVTGTVTSTGRYRVGARVIAYVSHGTYTLP